VSGSSFWRWLTYPLLTRASAISSVERQRIELGGAIWTAELRESGDDGYDLEVSVDRQSVGPVISWREDAGGKRMDTIVDGDLAPATVTWGPAEVRPGVCLRLKLLEVRLSVSVHSEGTRARAVCRQVEPQSWILEPWRRQKIHSEDSPPP
jgi:hypothetical protein